MDGIRVLDFTHVLSGPFGSALLGDLGADIIKVESPMGDMTRMSGPPFQNRESAYFLCVNRNKRSISIDLKKPEAKDIIINMVKKCDVFMENFRPGVMDRLGFGYDDMIKVKPDLIYSSLSAFGKNGPYRDKPGFELITQALTGLVDITTPPGGSPAKIQIQIVDLCGGIFLAFVTLSALYHKLSTGRGQRVETSLLESTLAMLANLAGIYFMTNKVPTGMGSRNPQAFPSQVFRSKDGYFAMVGHWDRLCKALGKPEWIEDPNFGNNAYRVAHYDEMVEMVESITTLKTTAEWLTLPDKHQVAAGKLNSVEEAFEDPGVLATDIVKTLDHKHAGKIKVLDKPWHLSETPGGLRLPPPALGLYDPYIWRDQIKSSYFVVLGTNDEFFGIGSPNEMMTSFNGDKAFLAIDNITHTWVSEKHLAAWRMWLSYNFRQQSIPEIKVHTEKTNQTFSIRAEVKSDYQLKGVKLYYAVNDSSDWRFATWFSKPMELKNGNFISSLDSKDAHSLGYYVEVEDSRDGLVSSLIEFV